MTPEADKGRLLANEEDRGLAHDEDRRLRTLREYRILDTAAEPGFDRITKLVADLFDAPITLVSLIDDCRQWFKSSFGLDVPETPRDISFCQFVVSDDKPMVVTDASLDPRFKTNPLVTGAPDIRFYAGVPLRAYNGAVLGSLCVIDRRPRAMLTPQELERLEDFAAIIMVEADLRRISIERDAARHMLERALDFSGVATWQLDPRTDHLQWRGAVAELWGADYETALTTAEQAFERIHPEDHGLVRAVLEESIANGTPYSVEHRILHPDKGMRWLSIRGDWDVASNDAMLTGISLDITEQRNRRDNDTILMRELHHRMRNLFATVGAIISLTRHAATDVDDYVERISSRLDALNRAQNVLLGANFLTGSMHALLREVEAAFPRISWSGPDLELPENAVVAMALLFNELATNAVKHGALASDKGEVGVHWTQDAESESDRHFRLVWTESGGTPVEGPPERTSFGTLLMERSVRNNLGGTIERRWEPGGLVVTIILPARWRDA
jgi:two-component sensor histidine kinase